jgi:hypothetical protein
LERLEIEVKNVSTKPVYYLLVVIEFPGVVTTTLDGVARFQVLPLTYGRRDFLSEGSFGRGPGDKPIKPGESHVFTIPELYRS